MMTDTKNTVNGDWCLQNGALINLNYTIHPTVRQSISSTRFSCTQGHWWQPLPAVIGGGDRLTLSQQISEPHRDKQSFTVTHTHTNMQLRVSNSPQMYVPELDVGGAGEPRRHEENKPHTEGSRPEMEPTNLLLWGGSANNCVIQKSHFMWKKTTKLIQMSQNLHTVCEYRVKKAVRSFIELLGLKTLCFELSGLEFKF